jgi:histone-lysine N-methyltransferase SETMAR
MQTKKFMFTIMWNPRGFHVIGKLPVSTTMNSDDFTVKILETPEQRIFPDGRKPHAKRLVVHLDNCSVHTSAATMHCMDEHGMRRLIHPPYSPNLAPSDFYLFPRAKEKLLDIAVVDEDDLFYRLQEILNEIPAAELRQVFQNWMKPFGDISRGMEATYHDAQWSP